MDNLPNELIIEIFTYLESRHLFNIALTCKKHNEIISNTPKIMKKFIRRIHRQNCKFEKRRKYQRIKIVAINEFVLESMENIGESIVNINLWLKRIHLDQLRRILIACPNLKKLSIRDNVKWISDKFSEPLPKLQLDRLDFGGCHKVYNILKECNLKNLFIDYHRTDVKSSIVKNFIKRQKNLEVLEIVYFFDYYDVFNDETLIDVEFRLKTLKIHCSSIENLENFKKFLQQQTRLREVILLSSVREIYTEVLNILRDFPNIKKLHLCRVKFDFKPMRFIETLTLGYSSNTDYRKFHELFPNVTSLTVTDTYSIHIVENFLDESRIEIKIPNVKSLTLDGCMFYGENPFQYDNIKFEHLQISQGDEIAWLHEWLRNNEIKLKSLVLLCNIVPDDLKQYIYSIASGDNKRIETLTIKDYY